MDHWYILGAFAVALLLTLIPGNAVISYLHKLKFGQHILEIGPRWHRAKQGTPTMGGILFIAAVVCAVLVFGAPYYLRGDLRPLAVLVPAVIFGGAGFVDDMTKIRKKQNEGLTPLQKLLLQTAAAVVFLTLLRIWGYDAGGLYIPFVNITIPMNWYIYAVIAAIFIVGMDNAVNLTDGIDGLCAGVTVPVSLLFLAVAVFCGDGKFTSVAVPAAALLGGMLGFLYFNFNPARVFMGDTGSLFIGGMVCALAFAVEAPAILILAGFVYILEMASVILQVGFFKLTHGKRLFKMAPIHHHFEMCGWGEKKIFLVAVGITALLCAVSFVGLKLS
ncbi:MAG: phospho-N-acetylmuramoyl-pentapeptide-transferase [Clostridia bacterium]|nr:phospho-N-acetylmuramoyl-pentapeptide-transferase [Clostridia bacterium]